MRHLLSLIGMLFLVAPLGAADKFDPEQRASAIAPYLDAQTVGVLRFDLERMDINALMNWAADLGMVDRADLTEPKHMASALIGGLKLAGVREAYAVISLADLPRPVVLVFPVNEKTKIEAIVAVCDLIPIEGHEKIGSAMVCGGKATVERVKAMKPVARPELVPAFTAAGDTAVQALLLPSADSRRLLEEFLPHLPKEFGGAKMTTLTKGALWVAAGLDLPPKPAAKFTVQSLDHQHAVDLKQLWNSALVLLMKNGEAARYLPNLGEVAQHLSPEVKGDRLTLVLDDKKPAFGKFLGEVGQRFQAITQEAKANDQLKEFAIAMHSYANDHKNAFPAPAILDKNGKPLLSWRVHLLPYFNQKKLYDQFHLDEPWDSEHNKKLLDQMPAVFAGPKLDAKKGLTPFVVPLGEDTLFGAKKPIRFQDITDGTSNTLLLVELAPAHAVPWTKPVDWTFDPKDHLKGLIDEDLPSFNVVFADGVARPISRRISAETLKALLTRAGGEVVNEIP